MVVNDVRTECEFIYILISPTFACQRAAHTTVTIPTTTLKFDIYFGRGNWHWFYAILWRRMQSLKFYLFIFRVFSLLRCHDFNTFFYSILSFAHIYGVRGNRSIKAEMVRANWIKWTKKRNKIENGRIMALRIDHTPESRILFYWKRNYYISFFQRRICVRRARAASTSHHGVLGKARNK